MVRLRAVNRGGGSQRRRGFTLIELLVALAVLVVGIYAMLRVFPPGYQTIEAGEQQTVAAQLADAELARWRLDPETLPDAIIGTDYQGNQIPATLVGTEVTLGPLLVVGDPLPGQENYTVYTLTTTQLATLDQTGRGLLYMPTDLTPARFDGAQLPRLAGHTRAPAMVHPNWQPNSMYLPRTIIGERVDIRQVALDQQGVPFHLLSHAPVDALRYEDDPSTPTVVENRAVYFDVYDARPWRYIPSTSTTLATLGARQFTFFNGNLYFGYAGDPPTVARYFKVDYTDRNTRQRVFGVTVTVPAGLAGPGTGLPSGAAPDPATIHVYERLLPLTDYQYAAWQPGGWWPRNGYYVNAATAVSGRILFSPYLRSDPRPDDMTLVKVDYRVADWQILVFDVEVPPGGVVQLPVRGIKSAGYTNPPRQPRPQEIARGVRRFFTATGVETTADQVPLAQANWANWVADPRSHAFVVAVDRQTGELLTDNEAVDWPTNPWVRRTRFRVNYREGLLYFNYDPFRVYGYNPAVDTPDRAGRTYRIFCRAENDWAVQLTMAPRQYARSATGLPGGAPTGATAAGGLLTYAWRTDAPRQLFFPLSEAGQTVVVDYYYDDPALGRKVYVSGEVHDIGAPNVTALGVWACPLRQELGHTPTDWGPTAVRGLSVRARVTWVTRGRASTVHDLVQGLVSRQVPRPSLQESWHQSIVGTYLTRAPI